mgnify:CR=1 FL=1
MQNSEKNFANGMIVNRRQGAPDFVVANVAINVAEFVEWLNANKNDRGWINLDLKVSQNGKYYAEQNTWTPNSETKAPQTQNQQVANGDDD